MEDFDTFQIKRTIDCLENYIESDRFEQLTLTFNHAAAKNNFDASKIVHELCIYLKGMGLPYDPEYQRPRATLGVQALSRLDYGHNALHYLSQNNIEGALSAASASWGFNKEKMEIFAAKFLALLQ
ncbi:hypothetical protein NDI45_28990 [Leptolyngbya sp. GB1-A1]|uniref:hypothetical protein n=1 Tax=Leptolyngbya sp. GB1-A1 TaxID=2933908 RepID=UPI00329A68BD